MTIGKLHKILTRLIENGHARKGVCVQKETFRHDMESDGAVILDVKTADLEFFPMIQEDGGTLLDNGDESCHTAIVLRGDYDPNWEIRQALPQQEKEETSNADM